MTNKDIQYIIDNVPFDYSIKIKESKIRCSTSPILKSEFPEPSLESDQQISCEKENKDSEIEASTSLHTSKSKDTKIKASKEAKKAIPEIEVSVLPERVEVKTKSVETISNYTTKSSSFNFASFTNSNFSDDEEANEINSYDSNNENDGSNDNDYENNCEAIEDEDKINGINVTFSDDEEDAGYYYDLSSGKKFIKILII
ncbi:hypothetical protein Glove_200g21 [Diversispora epigaea]|uniref:Uncharacterized protein n=1 Tax=Diversispora epigaea TaxID=1348612 RepID=A0A397IJV2_9GLOM|nr:hypothetical protein Glove_200g21 [Diversispora epigaea]